MVLSWKLLAEKSRNWLASLKRFGGIRRDSLQRFFLNIDLKKWSLCNSISYNLKSLSQKLPCYLSLTFDSKFPILFHLSSHHSVLSQLTFFMFSQIYMFFSIFVLVYAQKKNRYRAYYLRYMLVDLFDFIFLFSFSKLEFHYSKEICHQCLKHFVFHNLVSHHKISGDFSKPRPITAIHSYIFHILE